jgi:hypothetical protein
MHTDSSESLNFNNHCFPVLMLTGLMMIVSAITWKMHPEIHLLTILAASQFLLCFFSRVYGILFHPLLAKPGANILIDYYFLITACFLLGFIIIEYLAPNTIVGTGAKFIASSIASLIFVVLAYLANRALGSR